MDRLITVEIRISDKYRRFADLRACLDLKESDIRLAITPIKSNDDPSTYDVLEMQYQDERDKIEKARFEQAAIIASQLGEYIATQLFSINDTHNGYRKDST